MKPEKPSRNEDEYFAREEAELMRRQREGADALSTFRGLRRGADKPSRGPGAAR